jgi:general nucleoside transport system ATP-binding protein
LDPARPARLAIAGLGKRYGALTALARLDLALPGGIIHGILGENGAGKSTLVRLIAGATAPDAGSIAIDGTTIAPGDPRAARRAGVGVVHQHFALVGALTVAENLALGRPEIAARWLTPARLAADARALAESHGIDIGDPTACCAALPVGMQARIEILRALAASPRVLLLDEPTAVLTPHEIDELFATLRRLRDGGLLVLFVTHKLDEALGLCDGVSVLRRGALVTTVAADTLSADALAQLMVGSSAAERHPHRRLPAARRIGDPLALVVRDLVTDPGPARPALHDVALTVAAGEIVGIAGVDGNGQHELAAALAGLQPRRGTVVVHGTTLPPDDVVAAERAGLVMIPGDRRRDGLAPGLAVWENAILAAPLLARFGRRGRLDVAGARAFATTLVRDYRVSAPSLEHPVGALSGGNQQRIVIGRALALAPRALLAVNPTRGLDIAASAQVHGLLLASAAEGAAIVLISTDLDELAAVCDRVVVLYRGRLSLPMGAEDRAHIAAAMAGVA